jgi:hypothetical protein
MHGLSFAQQRANKFPMILASVARSAVIPAKAGEGTVLACVGGMSAGTTR